MSSNPLEAVNTLDQSLVELMGKERDLAFGDGELSKKQKLLIALAIDMTLRAENGIKALAGQALAAGATKQEIVEILRIVHHICGVGCTYQAAGALNEVL